MSLRSKRIFPVLAAVALAAAVRTAHLLIQKTESACPGTGSHDEELVRLLAHPQLGSQALDWRAAAEGASSRAGLWHSTGRN